MQDLAPFDARANFVLKDQNKPKPQNQNDKIVFRAQEGRQTQFLQCEADICIYGGAAGGGKSYGLMLDPLRHCSELRNINAAIFRRTMTDLKKPGGLWDETKKIYPYLGAKPNNADLNWSFKTNSRIKLSGLQYELDMLNWQGAQLDFIGFDELTHFTAMQFWYLIGRLRSVSGLIRPYCRATCNPENNWVYQLIKWWINEDGSPSLERAGKIRWFYKQDDLMNWFDTEAQALRDLNSKAIKNIKPLSLTFIPANINDNQILLKNNPNYYAMLSQLPEDERIKLLDGNWLFRPKGKLFKPAWFGVFAINVAQPLCRMITVDTASDIKSANDYTVFQVWAYWEGKIYLEKQVRGKFEYNMQLQLLESLILETEPWWVSIEKASTGHSLLQDLPRRVGVPLLATTRTKDKYSRAYEVQPYIQSGYVLLNPKADYYTDFIGEISQFSPENKTKQYIHDDQVDAMVDGIYYLLIKKIGLKRQQKVPINNHANRKPAPVRLSSVY